MSSQSAHSMRTSSSHTHECHHPCTLLAGGWSPSTVELIGRSMCNDLGPESQQALSFRGWHSLMSA